MGFLQPSESFAELPKTLLVNTLEIWIYATLLAVVGYAFYSYALGPLAGIPGPLSARLGIPGWYFMRAVKRDLGWQLKALHDRHGPLVRVSPRVVSIADPSAIAKIYEMKESGWKKTPFYVGFDTSPDKEPNIFTTLDAKLHAAKRRPYSGAYSMQTVSGLEEFVNPVSEKLVAHLDDKVARRQSVEMGHLLQYYAMDVVGELAFGKDFNMIASDTDEFKLMPALEDFNIDATIIGTVPLLKKPINWFTALLTATGYKSGGIKHLVRITIERVNERMERTKGGEEGRPDMLTKLLKSKHADGRPFGFIDVAGGASMAVGAGSDTTAIALRAFIYFMIRNPQSLKSLLWEINEALNTGALHFPVPYAEGIRLPYLQACIKETLRLHPSVFWLLPRYTPKDGVVLADRHFPAGIEVAMSPFIVQRTTAAYGPDAQAFRPERWLDRSPEELIVLNRNLITFGSGTRTRICLGKHITIMEMTKILPQLLHRYTFQFTPRSATSPHMMQGKGYDGKLNDAEPWHMEYQWFSGQQDYWLDVARREV